MRAPSEAPTLEAAGPMVPAPFEVVGRQRETQDTWTLQLRADGGERPSFAPGQFTMLSAAGAGEVPISISGDPTAGAQTPLVHTVRAVGLATNAICRAREGDVLGVRGPFGRAWPVEDLEGVDVLVVAGGIGLAPLRPAIHALLARRPRLGRLLLLYGSRAPDQMLFEPELAEWSERGLDVSVTVDSAGPEWVGHVGVVPRLVHRARFDPAEAVSLLCGPEVMMRFTAAALIERGVGGDRIYASMERNMQCGIGRCGHCQLGPTLICRDGPVYRWSELAPWLAIREL
ncbi:MAG TPA: FAD/NAD(P)-binding protein [Solirubrobacteraceae bacterium]|nr:FAD/NAD(P)-binding protein [Solirubrobacteraceae bacterium]